MEEDKKTTESIVAENETVTEAPKKRKNAKKRFVPNGQVHIQATFNNTIITVTDPSGAALTASSAGANGFRGSKKGTAYAASIAVEKAIAKAKKDHGLKTADVFVKGIGLGRDSSVRAVATAGVIINSINDKTPIAHGGVRPKGERKP